MLNQQTYSCHQKVNMYCPEISQSLQVLLISINIFIVGSLVPTVILNSEKTIRYTSVVILLITILITAAQVITKKKIEKWLMLTFYSTRILSTLVLFWATQMPFMNNFALSLSMFCSSALIIDALKHLHQPPTTDQIFNIVYILAVGLTTMKTFQIKVIFSVYQEILVSEERV